VAEWDKRDDETALAYNAFTAYYQMPVRERGIDAAWRASAGNARGKRAQIAPRHWYSWSSAHDWVRRAAAYDQHLAKQDEQLWEERRRRKKEREWTEAEQIRDVLEEAIPHARQFIRRKTAYVRGEDGQSDREIITVEFDIVGLATVAEKMQKIQSLVLGDSTENVNLSGAALISVIEAEFRRLALVDDGAATPTLDLLTAHEDTAEDEAAGAASQTA
jgi:hypothetical protein